jgi:4'-phosphopantetheinyl transferase
MNPLSVTQLHQRLSTLSPNRPEARQLDIWLLSTRMTSEEIESHWSTLPPDERERAGRFHFEADRNRFIAARGGLRAILSARSGVPAARVAFEIGSHGKPSLRQPAIPIEFNVSHSGDCALIGITTGTPCGVDIECARIGRSQLTIAERFFCARELEWLKQTKGGFLRLWTAKEAIIKAVGRGLSIPLSDVDVTDVVNGITSSITLETSGLARRIVSVRGLNLAENYPAAVAVDGDAHTIRIIADNTL